MDIIQCEILADGTLKLETDRISGPNHMAAESLFRELAKAQGGEQKRTLKVGASLHHALHAHVGDGHSHGPEGHGH